MKEPQWTPLKLETNKVPARPRGMWTAVYEYVSGTSILRFKAKGDWAYAKDRKCGPDGVRGLGLPQDVLVPGTPLGALVGKIGGSSADKPDPAKQQVFAVGSECVVGLDGKFSGTLFLTMNDEPTQFASHDGEIEIEISEIPSTIKPAGA
jgi:hypothetical protein